MKVNRNNYEVWMIDYFDGKLNASEIEGLMAFIDANEDIREEFELFSNETLDKEEVTFYKKEQLKKIPLVYIEGIGEDNYVEFFIASYENDLNEKQHKQLNEFLIANPQLTEEYKLHSRLILAVEGDIIFENKDALKKKTKVRPIVYWLSGAAAAMILIFFTIFNLLVDSAGVSTPQNERYTLDFLAPANPKFIITSSEDLSLNKRTFLLNTDIQTGLESPTTESRQEIASLDSRNVGLNISDNLDFAYITTTTSFDTDELYAENIQSDEPKKRKGVLGRIIKNLAGRVSGDVRNNEKEKSDKKDPTFVRILDQSLTVFNTITGSDNELVKTYDKDGSLSKYHFEGETLGWSKNYTQGANTE